jgi:signal peptide peptidase SppA
MVAWLSQQPVALPENWSPLSIAAEFEARVDPRSERRVAGQPGNVAVIPVRGVIIPKANFYEVLGLATSVQTIGLQMRAAIEDPAIKAVVMDVNSPGGIVSGVTELANELRGMRGRKPIVAQADHLMASAAYWIASSADEIVASPGAAVGSVGVYGMHVDQSRLLDQMGLKVTMIADPAEKAEGNAFEPLSADAADHMRKMIAYHRALFRADVAAGRGIAPSDVADNWARVYTPPEAKAMNMINKVRSMAETLAAYGISTASAPGVGRAEVDGKVSRQRAQAVRQAQLDAVQAEFRALGVCV